VLPLHNSAKWESNHKMVRKSAERVKHVALSTLYFPWIFISFSGKNKGDGKYLKVFKQGLATFLRILASYLNLITIYILASYLNLITIYILASYLNLITIYILASYLNLITIYISQTSRYGKQKYVKSNIIYFYV